VTLKSRLGVTHGHWKQHHSTDLNHLIRLIVERFDVEYYGDLAMWVRGHSMSLKMVPFKSLGTLSYSPSITTMAASLAISEIFSIKKWPDLEIWVTGNSKSLKLVPFETFGAISYSPSIVTITPSFIVCEIY